ncbi:corytuberine synthase-like [Magnolia sinica]|uniref:corytuberine synthase-like n=1 Tax=Magnolia sinica TaxID=86752 RepID=UPI0026586BEA|nr:corytuberine synthase-like [Magnolia sinica]
MALIWLLMPLILIFLFKPSSTKNLPPGPRPWPIIGNMMSMLSGALHIKLMKLARVHGPLMLLKFGSKPVIIVSTQESAMEVLRTHDRAFSGRSVPHSLRIVEHIKHSLVWSDCTDEWKNLRRIAKTELFSTKMLDMHARVRQEKVSEMVDYIRENEGGPIMITGVVFGTLLNILGHGIFSKDVFQFGGKGDEFRMQKVIRKMIGLVVEPNLADFYPILGGLDLQGLLRECKTCFDEVIEVWKDTVKERRANRDSSKHDVLEVLLDNEFSDAQINAFFLESFGPGSESSSTAVEWAMAELLKHPDKMTKLRDELNREVGPTNLTEAHLPSLRYLQACIKETLRLHPVLPFLLPHRTVETCQVMGYTIPKNYETVINAYAIGRDPNAWTDPDTFWPERFLDTDVDYSGNHYQLIPFGAGRRICPGIPLSNRAIPLLIGSLIHTFDWSLPNGMKADDLDMTEKMSLTLVINPSLVAVPKVRV